MTTCNCSEKKKPVELRAWRVARRHWACSAFEGYRRRYSEYSYVQCLACSAFWKTKAKYVESLKDEGEEKK